MKLATLKDGSRDGQLVVVSHDLALAHHASGMASRLQQVLDDWNFISPQLEDLSNRLSHGKARHAFAFSPQQCMAPLPRAHQWAGEPPQPDPVATPPRSEPLLVHGASDGFLGPTDDAVFADAAWGIDHQAQVAVVTGDVELGTPADAALDGVRLVMLANAWALRHLPHGRPAAAFSPVAVTPDELGAAWHGGALHLALETVWNGRQVGLRDAGQTAFHFGQRIAQLAKTRNVRAGSIVGSGAVSATALPDLQFGDTIRIDMRNAAGSSIFGAIDQRVAAAGAPAPG